jgi:hypothetical protein
MLGMETQYRALVEGARDAMVIIGPDGISELVNAPTEALFGSRTVHCVAPQTSRLPFPIVFWRFYQGRRTNRWKPSHTGWLLRLKLASELQA